MPNFIQAPEIKFSGEKFKETPELKGKAIYSHLFMNALMNGLGERDCAALKIMLFLCGNAQGFKVAEKTICERCNISETGYRKARNKLVDLGIIIRDTTKVKKGYRYQRIYEVFVGRY